MTKKIIALALVLLMLLPAIALGDTLPRAAHTVDYPRLERYAAWQEQDGQWQVHSNETEAALAQFGQETGGAVAYFYVELTGDRSTGLIQPELVFVYYGYTALDADTASIAVDGYRYDFQLTHETAAIGRLNAEVMRAPLDSVGVTALRRIMMASSVSVRLMGSGAYTFTPTLRDSYATTRQQIEASSLMGISAMLAELDAMGIASYDLWDLNARRWAQLYGESLSDSVSMLGRGTSSAISFSGDFEMLSRDDTGASVRALQDLLISKGFMQGRADASFGDGTDRAVRAARRYYGLMECGIADSALITCLEMDSAIRVTPADQAEMIALGDVCQLSLARCWFAPSFICQNGGDIRQVINGDNLLFIADGGILNTSNDEVTFYRAVTAALSIGDVSYPCTLSVEGSGGTRLDSSILPQGEGRLILCAEVPSRVADMAGLTLTVTAGDESVIYEIGG